MRQENVRLLDGTIVTGDAFDTEDEYLSCINVPTSHGCNGQRGEIGINLSVVGVVCKPYTVTLRPNSICFLVYPVGRNGSRAALIVIPPYEVIATLDVGSRAGRHTAHCRYVL